ncbi:MAG: N-acetylmuramoyl-L-alanine amidase, partial [Paraclostridium sp.]
MKKIAISKGHNCSMDIGANGFVLEDKVNKEVGDELILLLNNDDRFTVVDVTPGSATSVSHSLKQRVTAAQNNGCDILIDLHHNA